MFLTVLMACGGGQGIDGAETDWIYNLEVQVAEDAPTVLEVTFDAPADVVAWIEYGLSSPDESTTSSSTAAGNHSISVIGGGAYTEVMMRVVVESDGEQFKSGVFSATTEGLMPGTPTFEVTVDNYDPPQDAVLLMGVYNDPSYLVMLNFDGDVVWSRSTGTSQEGYGLGVLPVDGEIHYNFFEKGINDGAYGKMSLTGEKLSIEDTPGGHHFFSISPDGEPVWIKDDVRSIGNEEVVGDQIVVGLGEDARSIFSTWDHFTFEPNPGTAPEWTHANWVEYHPDRDSYLISTAYTDTLVEMDTEGNPLRIFGGRRAAAGDSDYVFDDPGSLFSRPHGINWTSKGDLLVFSTIQNVSSVIRYEINDDTGVMIERWRFGEEYGYEAMALGEVHELSDGNILIGWGSVGLIQVVDPTTNTVLWEAQSALEQFPTQLHYLDNPYITK
jgi:hypothetical protein